MFVSALDVDFARCVFAGNEAASGGALYLTSDISVEMENCTFAGNAATNAAVSMLPPSCCFSETSLAALSPLVLIRLV